MSCFDINRFHVCAMAVWQLGMIFATQMLFPIFSTYVPSWRCNAANGTWAASAAFAKDCHVYEQCPAGEIEWENAYFHSASLEYGWVCGPYAYLAHAYSQVQFFGVLLGTFAFGTLSDHFGRKPVGLLALSMGMLTLFASGWAPSWQLLLAARFLVGLSIGGTIVAVYTLVMENLLPQQRMPLRAFCNWGVARLLLTAICYALPEWRSASIVYATLSLPALLIIVFIFPESPIWLHSKDRLEEMRNSERWIARVAGVQYVEVHHGPLERKEGLLELLRDRAMISRIGILWLMWFTASVTSYAIDLNSSSISGNLFYNQALFSLFIAGSKMLLVTLDTLREDFSRRNLHHYAQSVVIVCFLALTVLTLLRVQGPSILVLNLFGSAFVEYTWDACYLSATESMPTHMRASATGSCSLMARAGAVIAPSLNYLNTYWPPSVYISVMGLGALNLLTSYVWMVETKGINLDDVKLHGQPAEAQAEAANGGEAKEMSAMLSVSKDAA